MSARDQDAEAKELIHRIWVGVGGIGIGVIATDLVLTALTPASELVILVKWLIFSSTALALLLMMVPIYLHTQTGLHRKRTQVRGLYSPYLISEYFSRFQMGRPAFKRAVENYRLPNKSKADEAAAEAALVADFDIVLDEFFGKRRFILPALLLLVVAGYVLFFGFAGAVELAQHQSGSSEPGFVSKHFGFKVDLVSLAAIFGAYCWVISDAIDRYHQEGMQPSNILAYAFRMLVAVVIGQVIAAWTADKGAPQSIPAGTLGPLLAFLLNALSYDQIIKLFTSMAHKYMGAGGDQDANDMIVALPGVDTALAERFKAEGITTIAQIAATDPLRLAILTNQPFSFILELIDEAILWNFTRDSLFKLALHGWKGASHILNFCEVEFRKLEDRIAGREGPITEKLEAPVALDAAGASAPAATDAPQAMLANAGAAVASASAQTTGFFNDFYADKTVLFQKLEEASGLKVVQLQGIVEEIRGNDYAKFINKLMQAAATSSSDPIGPGKPT
jgi:hypothetical protein